MPVILESYINTYNNSQSTGISTPYAEVKINKKKEVEEKDNNTPFKIGISTAIVLAVLLLSSKGLQKIVGDKLNKFKDYLDYHLEINSLENKSKTKQFTNLVMRKVSSFLRKAQSVNNITSLKDILFKKIMYQTKFTRSIHDGISNWFEKASKKTVDKSYAKTRKVFNEMYTKFDKLDEYILKHYADEIVEYEGKKYTVPEMIAKLREHRDGMKIAAGAFLEPKHIEELHARIKKANSNLCSTFWDASFKDFCTKNNKFKRKEMWQTFIAEEQMKEDKTKLANIAYMARQVISNDSNNVGRSVYNQLNELKNMLPIFDTKDYSQLRKLEWFAKKPEVLKNSKNLFLKELGKLEQPQKFDNIDSQTVSKLEEIKKGYVETINGIMAEDGMGEIQYMLPIYYKIAPFELEKLGVSMAVKKALKSFDKSLHLQLSELFDKIRDLELGSAPTDILTIVLSSGLITYELAKAKDKDETRTVVLTSGIPLAGAIATTMVSTTKLVSGGKSLALGAISGIVLNIIGKQVAKLDILKSKDNKQARVTKK